MPRSTASSGIPASFQISISAQSNGEQMRMLPRLRWKCSSISEKYVKCSMVYDASHS